MPNILEFLNTADSAELRALPGLDAGLAGRILAARPFATRAAALQASGMDEAQFAELEAAISNPPPPPAPALPSPADTRAQTSPPRTGPGLGARLARAAANLLRLMGCLVVLLAAGGAVVAGMYFVPPYVYDTFVQPVESNATRISQLATQQVADLAGLSADLATANTDLATASAGQAAANVGLATASADLAALQTRLGRLEARADSSEAAIAAHTEAITALQAVQSEIGQALTGEHDAWLAELDYQVRLARARELLARSYLYLSQSNFGLARLDVLAARGLLAELQPAAPEDQRAALAEVRARLDLALANLPAFPVVAANDVEIAWRLLIDGLPADVPTTATLTPAPDTTPVVTPSTPAPTAAGTSAPPEPTVTP